MDQTGSRQQILKFRCRFVSGSANNKNILFPFFAVRQKGFNDVAARVAGNQQAVTGPAAILCKKCPGSRLCHHGRNDFRRIQQHIIFQFFSSAEGILQFLQSRSTQQCKS